MMAVSVKCRYAAAVTNTGLVRNFSVFAPQFLPIGNKTELSNPFQFLKIMKYPFTHSKQGYATVC